MIFLLSSLILLFISKEFILLNEEFFIIFSFLIVLYLIYYFTANLINQELINRSISLKQSFYDIYNLKLNYIVSLLQFYFFFIFWFVFFFNNIKQYFLNINKLKINIFFSFLDKVVSNYLFFVMEVYLNKFFNNVNNLYFDFTSDIITDEKELLVQFNNDSNIN